MERCSANSAVFFDSCKKIHGGLQLSDTLNSEGQILKK